MAYQVVLVIPPKRLSTKMTRQTFWGGKLFLLRGKIWIRTAPVLASVSHGAACSYTFVSM